MSNLQRAYHTAVAEEIRSHDDVVNESDLAPITDETLREGNEDRRSERERLMDELGLCERDFR